MEIKKIKLILPFLIILSFFACDSDVTNNEIPEITSFIIPSLDIEGVIEDKTITITVPEGFDFTNTLTPEITVSNNGTLSPASGVAQDFSINPLIYTAYSSSGEQSIYNVVVKEAVTQAAVGDVYISEVFTGSKSDSSTGTQIQNSYIELYNSADVDFDLSQFTLKLVESDSSANTNLDVTVGLVGTISANSTFTLYNKDIETSLLNSLYIIKDSSNAVSDIYLNGITALNGTDQLELLQAGVVVDLFNPTKGKESYSNYMAMKKFIRKGGKISSAIWNDEDWILYGISGTTEDDDTVGIHSEDIDSEAMNFTYFAFEQGFAQPVMGIIDNAAKTVNVTLPEGTDASNLIPIFGISGKKVTVSSTAQENGVTSQDFSGDIVYTIWADNGGTKSYTVSTGEFTYTTENYSFNGNMQAVLDAMVAGGDANTSLSSIKDPEYAGVPGTVTGVVTAKDIYGYKTATKCFFIQDKDTGLYIFTDEGLSSDLELGTKITLTVTEGKVYFEMPEVTGSNSGSVTIVERNVPIYYQTGDYSSAESIGQVFLFEGAIEAGMDGNSVGQFTEDLAFHSSNDFEDSLAVGTTGKFYGPVTFSYDKYRMEINSSYQISE